MIEMGQTVCSTVIALCGDPGGANAVAPVIEELRGEEFVTVKALAYGKAQALWARRFLTFDSISESTTTAEAIALLRGCGAGLLLTGTSGNSVGLEKTFIEAAQKASVSSLAVLDFWSNYRVRFSDDADKLTYLPDRIAVMDERAHEEMVAEGFQSDRLVITGQPALDDLGRCRSRFTQARRDEIRRNLGVRSSEQLVMFLSQPLSELYGADPATPGHLGYTEQVVLGVLLTALKGIAARSNQSIVLVIRPHPREAETAFKIVPCPQLNIIVSTTGEPRDLVMTADVVTGMYTMLLLEACLLGCLTVSLQPGLRLPDMLPANLCGLITRLYKKEDIEPALERLLVESGSKAVQNQGVMQLDCGATPRVVKLVYKMMGIEAQM